MEGTQEAFASDAWTTKEQYSTPSFPECLSIQHAELAKKAACRGPAVWGILQKLGQQTFTDSETLANGRLLAWWSQPAYGVN